MTVLAPAPYPNWFLDETVAIVAEFTTPATTLRKKQIDGAIRQLKSGPVTGSDIFAKLDMLQNYRAADSQAARVDWIDPTRVASLTNSPSFSADVGFTTNGTNSYINTNFNPGDGGSYNFVRNSAHFGVDSGTSAGTGGSHSGRWNGTNGTTLQHRTTANDDLGARVNQAGGTAVVDGGIITDGAFDLCINRSGASALEIYRQGAPLTIDSGGSEASTAVVNGTMLVGTINTSTFQAIQAHCVYAGSSLTADEHVDRINAILAYEGNVGGGFATRTANFPLHAVRNAFDSDGRHYVIVGNEDLYVAEPGSTSYSNTYTFPDTPGRIYGLFVSSAGTVFVGTMDEATGIKGRTYRSTDQGSTFSQITTFDASFRSGNANFWPMVEDSNGDLYFGQYTVDANPSSKPLACKVWKSTNDGVSWSDISDSSWTDLHHVHGLHIDPDTGWLYATTGDTDINDGVWRSKLKDGSDWVQKTAGGYQYIPIESDGTYIYVGDDESDGTISRFVDDGTASLASPSVVHTTGALHNCYYIKRDPNGVLWACFPPTDATGAPLSTAGIILVSLDGANWYRIFRLPVMTYTDWNNTAVDGSTSRWSLHSGTTQFGPQARNFFAALNYQSVKTWIVG